ncbi:MAG TPA: serine/threonine-protein kinase [Thermoleophilaceae bacterium]|nr:serine/threonine-protein kinase [Thermoleophilaceae bacterium]
MSAPLATGDRVAPGYEVIEHLRRGRDLDVYDVWSEERACRCIVKALRPDQVGREGPTHRLLEEGRLLREATHPHIVRAYDVLEEPVPMVVMETLSGETLGHMIEVREAELSTAEIAQLGLHLCSAIRYLHAQGVLHLDLKPSNVIAECGRAKLLDLSVARPPGPAHAGIGTFYYMAPEQARGGELGPAADVWGIGVVLFEAATGEPAFDDPEAGEDDDPDLDYGDSVSETADEADYPQLTGRARRIDDLRPLPAELADLVAACLDPDPARRPSLEALMRALEPLGTE